MLNKKEITIIIVIILLFLFGGTYKFLQGNEKIAIASSGSPSSAPAIEASEISTPALPTTEATPTEVAVYISGAVQNPDVYFLPANSRVKDVVNMAGGFTADADKDQINLAQIIVDEEHIYVCRIGEDIPSQITTSNTSAAAKSDKSDKINLNTASKEELMTLPGIGDAIAQNIIDYRESNGGFHSTEEIKQVNRIGDKTYDKLKDRIDVK